LRRTDTPHVVIKLAAGRSETHKQRIADAVARAIVRSADCGADAVSIAIEDVPQADWDAKVFVPEIAGKAAALYKKPGYKAV
jgi:4-oxalocrotonate tautomerase